MRSIPQSGLLSYHYGDFLKEHNLENE
ncbi:MAG: hypothetical protein UW17_C0008G0001, partial [Candidatus Nomurabacteria bacterium GW2011_GWD1_44_10]